MVWYALSMPITIKCQQCSTEFSVTPARVKSARFCTNKCRGEWRKLHFTGSNNPHWSPDQIRVKNCQHCGAEMRQGKVPNVTFQQRKFCSKECVVNGQKRFFGADNHKYNPFRIRRIERGRQGAWARNVISRDNAKCKRCGTCDVELHAHHIKSFADNPDLRWDVANGETLCCLCHWDEHSALNANAVNSGNILTGHAEDNPEPSLGRKPFEGVTTRGRAYRRWNGTCDWCGVFISKRWSDTTGKKHLFCSRTCAATHNSNTREYCRPKTPKTPPMAVISSTSAARESDDIV